MTRSIGTDQVASIGLGCMGLSWAYQQPGAVDAADKARVIEHALDIGVRVLDTSDFYGPYANEELLGSVLRTRRADAFVSTKGGLVPAENAFMAHDGSPAHLLAACDASLRRLGVDEIDLYQLHRVDPAVPLEESWGALGELVAAGKVRHIGLCEVDVQQLEIAHPIHPVASVQSELSIWERSALAEIVPWCRARGAAFIAFSPLGRGFLSGTISASLQFDSDDFRSTNPRFTPEARRSNQRIVDAVAGVAARHGATPAQIALAWLLAVDEIVIPIPGTTKIARLDENLRARSITLHPDEITELSSLPPPVQPRY